MNLMWRAVPFWGAARLPFQGEAHGRRAALGCPRSPQKLLVDLSATGMQRLVGL